MKSLIKIECIENPESKKAIARKVLEALRDWFGIDESREQYIAESANEIFVAAREGNEYVGFLCLKETGRETVELAVKTVKMGVYEDYDITNRFYQSCGFREFEVIPGLWDEANPCQIYVMYLPS